MLILGIETSCDETAAALVEDGRRILSNIVSSQVDLHRQFWGIVPEIASRRHLEMIIPVIKEALKTAGVTLREVEAVAATYGPGLMGSLLVGLTVAKGIAYARQLPFIGVNHLEAHLQASFLSHPEISPPFIGLIISGGHTDLIYANNQGTYEYLGSTRDDAIGEAFDKVGRILGLKYPGGPEIEKEARKGNPLLISLPLPHFKETTLDFSFSGIKTAVLYYVKGLRERNVPIPVSDLAASFQLKVSQILANRLFEATHLKKVRRLVLGGGVCANTFLRAYLEKEKPNGLKIFFPSLDLCTDNAAMVAASGWEQLKEGRTSPFSLEAQPALRLGSDLNL